MCSGRVEPEFVFKALTLGADGVLVLGCHPGDCHYMSGNYKTMRRILLVKKLLEQLRVDQERVKLEWVSAAEGARFAQVVADFTNKIKELGPNSLKVRN